MSEVFLFMNYVVIMPVKWSDLHLVEMNYKRVRQHVGAKKIVVITNTEHFDMLPNLGPDVEFVDENKLYKGLTFAAAREEMIKAGLDPKQTGHCFQQLLKMAYCFVNSEEGYLVWDADTIPIRHVPFFDEGTKKYIFYMQKEHTVRYFDHMYKLLGIEKQVEKSFITEHMYFLNSIAREIVEKIDGNQNVAGDTWWAKITRAMITENGMSEYEIYGTYVTKFYPDLYELKDNNSLRYGRGVLGSHPTDKQMEWMSKEFAAISIEHFDKETFLTPFSSLSVVQSINPRTYASYVSFINRGINRLRRSL